MGLKTLMKRFQQYGRADRTSKTVDSVVCYHDLFKRAFEKAKQETPTVQSEFQIQSEATIGALSPHPEDECLSYSDTFVVADLSSNLLPDAEPLRSQISLGESPKMSLVLLKNQSPKSPQLGFDLKPLQMSCGPHHSSLTVCAHGPGVKLQDASYRTSASSHKRCKSLHYRAPRVALQRTQSQNNLVKYAGTPTKNASASTSRRSSVSYAATQKFFEHDLQIRSTMEGDMEYGMQKLHKRNACIELAVSQRRLAGAFSPGSANCSENSILSDDGDISDTSNGYHSTLPSSEDDHSDCIDHIKPELDGLGELPQAERASAEFEVLQAELAVVKSQKTEMEVQHETEVASKEEQVSTILSMYQALHAGHEDLKAHTNQVGTSQQMSQIVRLTHELRDANCRHNEHNLLLSQAYEQINESQQELTTSKATVADQENTLLGAMKETQKLNTRLDRANEAINDLEALIEKLKQLKTQTTSDLIDVKSECERTHLQNMRMREALEMSPEKAAEFDNTVGHLKSELAETDQRRMEAEENSLQLQKKLDEEQFKAAAEKAALVNENRAMSIALNSMRSNKLDVERAINTYFTSLQGDNMTDSLKAAIQSYTSAMEHDNQVDERLIKLVEMQHEAAEESKDFQVRCKLLKTAAKENEVKYGDLESDLSMKSQTVDFIEIEADAKKKEHEDALAAKDTEVAAAKRSAAHFEHLVDMFQHSDPTTVTSWFLRRQEGKVEKAKEALKTAEGRIQALEQDLFSKTYHEKMDKDFRDYAEYEAHHYLSPATQNEFAELKQKLEDLEFQQLCSIDSIKWTDHLKRIEEVRAQTTAQIEGESRAQLETTVNHEITVRFGRDYVKPLAELGAHLWARVCQLEQSLLRVGFAAEDLDDHERQTLVRVSKEFEVID